ncbi:MAG: LOG family protein [Thermodesulfobacteriota bacterium]
MLQTGILRGILQSSDGVIEKVHHAGKDELRFDTAFTLPRALANKIRQAPEHVVFSERSRIARLGIQVQNGPVDPGRVTEDSLTLTLTAKSLIPGYPSLSEFAEFFSPGFPVGRLVFCDPDALLTSEEVLQAVERAEIKLPESSAVSADGALVIAPHRVVCDLKPGLDRRTLGRILLQAEGRELLNRFQTPRRVPSVSIPAGGGVITTCSLYLNEHYVVLQTGYELGAHLSATVLDPIKTRGIRIYLEIVNLTGHPIVNPLIQAKVFRAAKAENQDPGGRGKHYSFSGLTTLHRRMEPSLPGNCHYLEKPVAVIEKSEPLSRALVFRSGPDKPCAVSTSTCARARLDFSAMSACSHSYATARLGEALKNPPVTLALSCFPNLVEHRDIINLASRGLVDCIYFFQASCEHGPFLSEMDHHRLQEYAAFGVTVYWVSPLNNRVMVHTMRDAKGYFVVPERLYDFHKAMLFAFYGSNRELSDKGKEKLGRLMDALTAFWGKSIGIVTGGGSGVMGVANTLARERGILSGANFLDITDQPMDTNVDFCQVFQDTCRHSRQKWFEIASFPIFNVGGLGTLEELGITLCNMKLSITEPVPVILFSTEGTDRFWTHAEAQIRTMVENGRAPAWVLKNLVLASRPEEVIESYRERLHLF